MYSPLNVSATSIAPIQTKRMAQNATHAKANALPNALFMKLNARISHNSHYHQKILQLHHHRRHNTNIHAQSCIYQMESHICNLSYISQTGIGLKLRFKEHICYITSNNPQSAYAIHILHSAHEYGPVETTVTLVHYAQKSKRMNTQDNHYINYFHQHNMIIKEQNQKGKSPFFEPIQDTQFHNARA